METTADTLTEHITRHRTQYMPHWEAAYSGIAYRLSALAIKHFNNEYATQAAARMPHQTALAAAAHCLAAVTATTTFQPRVRRALHDTLAAADVPGLNAWMRPLRTFTKDSLTPSSHRQAAAELAALLAPAVNNQEAP